MIVIDSYELLKKLHNYGIVNKENAKTLGQLGEMFNLSLEEIENMVNDLVNYKYVVKIKNEDTPVYHLSSQGIIAVCSIFT